MHLTPRYMMIAGVAFVVASGGGLMLLRQGHDETADHNTASRADMEICLQADLDFLPGDQSGCFGRDDLLRWEQTPLTDAQRGPLAVSLSHPDDHDHAPVQCESCRDFREYRSEGWYALTTREMRREAFFVRACGAIEMLRRAQPETISYFGEDGLDDEIAGLGAEQLLRFDEDRPEASLAAPEIERLGRATWRVHMDGQTVQIEAIATADFDADGNAEILAFLNAGPERATASVFDIALVEKDGPDKPLILTPLDYPMKNGVKKTP